MKKLSKLKKLTAVFVIAFFVVITNAVISYSNTIRLVYHQHLLNNSLQVIIQLERTLTAFNNSQTFLRTYLVTNNQNYLSGYVALVEQTNASVQQLQTLSHASDLEYINLLKKQIANNFKIFDSIQLQRSQNKDFKLKAGELVVDDIENLIEKIKANAEKRLETGINASEMSFGSAVIAFSITTVGNIALLGLLYFLLRSTITRLKLAEQRLAQSESRYSALWNASECIELIAQDSTLLEINPYGVKMMEVESATELLGKPVGMKVEHKYREAFAAFHESVCLGNRETLEFEVVIKGTRHWVETHAIPLLNESDGTFLNLSITRDITQRKQLEAQLLRLQRLDSIGSLASGIAHDLNNVLSIILLSTQLLQVKLRDSEHQQLLKTLENNVKLGANLVQQVLSFARGVDEQAILDLKTVFSEISLLITQTFPKSIVFQSSLPAHLAPVIGNTTQIQQVLMNLVVNARDAMPQGGKLTLAARHITIDSDWIQKNRCGASEGDFILITVTDTGTGIPTEITERIFEPFFTTKENGKGTGLGLSTTKTIISNHGGFINVSSKVGEGTCFKVYLPAQPTFIPHSSSLLTKEGNLIPVIDDEPAPRKITISDFINLV